MSKYDKINAITLVLLYGDRDVQKVATFENTIEGGAESVRLFEKWVREIDPQVNPTRNEVLEQHIVHTAYDDGIYELPDRDVRILVLNSVAE